MAHIVNGKLVPDPDSFEVSEKFQKKVAPDRAPDSILKRRIEEVSEHNKLGPINVSPSKWIKIRNTLRNHGMDSQQQEKAFNEIKHIIESD
jgi:hypothetical protein